jgi:hypothetical protein
VDEARRRGGVDLGTALRRDDGPPAPERAVALVEQLAASLDASHPQSPHHTGFAVGTVAYMAPEHFLGRPVGRPADVYAVACILFELLAGTPPFTGDADAVVHGHLHAPVPSLRAYRRDLPPALDTVIAVGTAKNPHDRYPTAGALAAAARSALTALPAPGPLIPAQTVRTPPPSYAPPTQWAPPPTAPPPMPMPMPMPMPTVRRSRAPVFVAIVAAALLASAVGAGLWLAPGGTAADAGRAVSPLAGGATTPPAPATPAGAAASVVGTWTGTYTCGQGATGLRLEVGGSDEASLSAVFGFSALPDNPGVPSGSFAMTGTQFGSNVDLRGSEWISRPSGYQTVDLSGLVSDDGATFDGRVRDAGAQCTTFHLTRVADVAT